MSKPAENRRILWMVWLLVTIGVATIVVMIVVVGWQIESLRIERAKIQAEQTGLYAKALEVLRQALAARFEIVATLDENTPVGNFSAADRLATTVDQLLVDGNINGFASNELKHLDSLTHNMADVQRRALVWRGRRRGS